MRPWSRLALRPKRLAGLPRPAAASVIVSLFTQNKRTSNKTSHHSRQGIVAHFSLREKCLLPLIIAFLVFLTLKKRFFGVKVLPK